MPTINPCVFDRAASKSLRKGQRRLQYSIDKYCIDLSVTKELNETDYWICSVICDPPV